MKRETRILVVGVVAFRPNYTGTGSFPAEMLIPFDRYLIALQFAAGSF